MYTLIMIPLNTLINIREGAAMWNMITNGAVTNYANTE